MDELTKYHSNESLLKEEIDDLKIKLEEADSKFEITQKLAETDAKAIIDLKNQIEHAWKMADSAHEREQQSQEMIEMLRKQVTNLNAEIDFKNKMGMENSEE